MKKVITISRQYASGERIIEKTDRERKMYAMSFYSKEWGNKNNYEILLNSGKLGIEKCVELIVNTVK